MLEIRTTLIALQPKTNREKATSKAVARIAPRFKPGPRLMVIALSEVVIVLPVGGCLLL